MSGLLRADSITNTAGTGGPNFPNGASSIIFPSDAINNLGIATSFASNAMTIAMKQSDGSTDPSTGVSAVVIGMRNSTLTSGSYNQRSVTAATSLIVPSGATLGSTSGNPIALWVYAMDNSGTIELAVSATLFREDTQLSTTAISGSSNSFTTAYSTSARTNFSFRLISKIVISQATAGTWTSSPTLIQVAPLALSKVPTIQKFTTAGSSTYVLPAGCTYIRVRMAGGGGGGAGSGTATSSGINGSGGNTSSFGSLSTGGGSGGTWNGSGGTGGTGTISAAVGFSMTGNSGISGAQVPTVGGSSGGSGGGSPLFGGTVNTRTNAGGTNTANASAGGQGGGGNNTTNVLTGSGGGGGGSVNAYIYGSNLAATFSYTVAASSNGGNAGVSGLGGSGGGKGIIVVEEYYD